MAWAAPHLDFVSPEVGYADAAVAGGPASNQGVFVTTNGGSLAPVAVRRVHTVVRDLVKWQYSH